MYTGVACRGWGVACASWGVVGVPRWAVASASARRRAALDCAACVLLKIMAVKAEELLPAAGGRGVRVIQKHSGGVGDTLQQRAPYDRGGCACCLQRGAGWGQ